ILHSRYARCFDGPRGSDDVGRGRPPQALDAAAERRSSMVPAPAPVARLRSPWRTSTCAMIREGGLLAAAGVATVATRAAPLASSRVFIAWLLDERWGLRMAGNPLHPTRH